MESTSVIKALNLLEATAGQPDGRTLASLAAVVGLAKPTAHRILKTLTALGYLERTATGIYRQTAQVNRLVARDSSQALLQAADAVLRNLHATTRETVNLGILRFGQVVYLQVLESPQPLRRVATPDSADPFYCTALGRAIIAHLSEPERRRLLSATRFERRTAHTTIDCRTLHKILEQTVQRGYAIEVDETDLGVTCVGAPILAGGTALAAISLSVPTVRARGQLLDALVKKVCAAAAKVSEKLAATAAMSGADSRSGAERANVAALQKPRRRAPRRRSSRTVKLK